MNAIRVCVHCGNETRNSYTIHEYRHPLRGLDECRDCHEKRVAREARQTAPAELQRELSYS